MRAGTDTIWRSIRSASTERIGSDSPTTPLTTASPTTRPTARRSRPGAKKANISTRSASTGGGKSKVVEGSDPSYSPDGKRIAYTGRRFFERDSEIYTIKVNGRHRTKVTNNNATDYWPSYSPDGKKIAFIRGRGRNPDIYTKNVSGGGKSRKVIGSRYIESNPSWGSSIAASPPSAKPAAQV